NGKQRSLGVKGSGNRKHAEVAWHRLVGTGNAINSAGTLPPPQDRLTPSECVQRVILAFLDDAQGRMSKGCVRNYHMFVVPFAKQFGTRSADTLTCSECLTYASKPEWSSTYRANCLATLVTAFKWGVRQGFIRHNPLSGVRKPLRQSRGVT